MTKSIQGTYIGCYFCYKVKANRYWLRCNQCGSEVCMDSNAISRRKTKDKNYFTFCHCTELIPRFSNLNRYENSQDILLGVPFSNIVKQIKKRLTKLGQNPATYTEYNITPDILLSKVGSKPLSDIYDYQLYIKEGQLPHIENFYWKNVVKTSVIDSIMANSRECNRKWLEIAIKSYSIDKIRHMVKYGYTHKHRPSYGLEGYSKYIGQLFGRLKITQVLKKESKDTYYYLFSYTCSKCGHSGVKRASSFLSGSFRRCKVCQSKCHRSFIFSKNSATYLFLKESRRIRGVDLREAYNVPVSLNIQMKNWISEYTISNTNPQHIYDIVELDLYKSL